MLARPDMHMLPLCMCVCTSRAWKCTPSHYGYSIKATMGTPVSYNELDNVTYQADHLFGYFAGSDAHRTLLNPRHIVTLDVLVIVFLIANSECRIVEDHRSAHPKIE